MLISDLGEVGDFEDTDVLSDDEAYIGTLLFHFLEVLQFNAHEVAQFEMIARSVPDRMNTYSIQRGLFDILPLQG